MEAAVSASLIDKILFAVAVVLSVPVMVTAMSIITHFRDKKKKSLPLSQDSDYEERVLSLVRLALGKDTVRIAYLEQEKYHALWIVPGPFDCDWSIFSPMNAVKTSSQLHEKIDCPMSEFRLLQTEKEVVQRLNDRIGKGENI